MFYAQTISTVISGRGGGGGVETFGTCVCGRARVCAGVHACVCLGNDEKDVE